MNHPVYPYTPYIPPAPDPLAEQKKSLRRSAQFTGTMMLFLTLFTQSVMTVLVFVLLFCGVLDYKTAFSSFTMGMDNTSFLLLYLPVYAVSMGLPMLISVAIFKPRFSPLDLSEKVSGGVAVACLFMGLGVCAASNFAAELWAGFFRQFGLESPSLPPLAENTVLSVVLNLIIFSVLPALLEEFLFRGYVLQSLRPYGDTFAVVTSSLLFGLMHCNLTQLPFAFLLGLALGFFTVKLNNIWVACAVHALNNALAVLFNDVLPYYVADEFWQNVIIIGVFGLLLAVGVILFVVFWAIRHPLFVRRPQPKTMSFQTRVGLCYGAPTMILAILLFIGLTLFSAMQGG